MSDGPARQDHKPTAARVVIALSCSAAFLSITASGPGHKLIPGTRTAVEMLAKRSERDLSKLAAIHIAPAYISS